MANVLKNEIQYIKIKEILSFIWIVKVRTKPQKVRVKYSNRYSQKPKTNGCFETNYNFPDTTEGTVLKHYFKFKNAGNQTLVIAKAVASCGCTVPSYPKYPIAPGQVDSILLEFDSHNRIGQNHKNVLIYSNHEGGSLSIGFNVLIK